MTLTTDQIAELRHLLARASDATWIVSGEEYPVVKGAWNDDAGGDFDITGEIDIVDAELIVAAVNSLPALLDQLEVASSALDKIAAAVQPDDAPGWCDADGHLEAIGNVIESTGRAVNWDGPDDEDDEL